MVVQYLLFQFGFYLLERHFRRQEQIEIDLITELIILWVAYAVEDGMTQCFVNCHPLPGIKH